ncbi:hypothetical protein MVES1_003394 [Malassezia vespertilionis]|uniref:uncharacterized protein n=1 Tax=Malassezia vespertilionis TaxID=2020962 RepID=UPI0024B0D903|nr:uncharacterized protein MVES1_003394 [Malassezia vespertilionis]WFD08025.1 hypothetical protein MVES1_003394 [Malassezia vespertilionis]
MPQAALAFPPAYTLVGVYRLTHDPNIWRPHWRAVSKSASQALLLAVLWLVLTMPFQLYIASPFIGRVGSAVGARHAYDMAARVAQAVHIPMFTYATLTKVLVVLNQINSLMELRMGKQLRVFRQTAYADTVASRGKAAEWWVPYTEEWEQPPDTAPSAQPRTLPGRITGAVRGRCIRFAVRKVSMIFFSSIPLFGMVCYASAAAVSYTSSLLQPMYKAKRMSTHQIALWDEEHRTEYFFFGLSALLLEHIPVLGLVFSVSNRIGAAMWAHDLEKRQHRFRRGELDRVAQSQHFPADGAPGAYRHATRADVPARKSVAAEPAV